FYSVEGEQDLAFVRPTTPLRESQVMDKIILEYQQRKNNITGLRSAHELSESPYKYFKIENGLLTVNLLEDNVKSSLMYLFLVLIIF
ncbi:MAG TPA: hypothetical protein DCM40_13610, partial [Maribacter sp.]|nr:hypothetical protein [Maribacter sp.]